MRSPSLPDWGGRGSLNCNAFDRDKEEEERDGLTTMSGNSNKLVLSHIVLSLAKAGGVNIKGKSHTKSIFFVFFTQVPFQLPHHCFACITRQVADV